MTHVLMLLKDPNLQERLALILSRNDIRCTSVRAYADVVRVAAAVSVDAIIIDLDLNIEEGLALVNSCSSSFASPVIAVSEIFTAEADKVTGLEAGAIDYMTFPLGYREFLARIRALTRERPEAKFQREPRSYIFGNWTLFVRQRTLQTPCNKDVELTAAEFNLLVAFLKYPKEILAREQLLAATRLYGEEILDRSIDVLILRLRRRLETDPSRPELIKTIRNKGYMFDQHVEVIERLRSS